MSDVRHYCTPPLFFPRGTHAATLSSHNARIVIILPIFAFISHFLISLVVIIFLINNLWCNLHHNFLFLFLHTFPLFSAQCVHGCECILLGEKWKQNCNGNERNMNQNNDVLRLLMVYARTIVSRGRSEVNRESLLPKRRRKIMRYKQQRVFSLNSATTTSSTTALIPSIWQLSRTSINHVRSLSFSPRVPTRCDPMPFAVAYIKYKRFM